MPEDRFKKGSEERLARLRDEQDRRKADRGEGISEWDYNIGDKNSPERNGAIGNIKYKQRLEYIKDNLALQSESQGDFPQGAHVIKLNLGDVIGGHNSVNQTTHGELLEKAIEKKLLSKAEQVEGSKLESHYIDDDTTVISAVVLTKADYKKVVKAIELELSSGVDKSRAGGR